MEDLAWMFTYRGRWEFCILGCSLFVRLATGGTRISKHHSWFREPHILLTETQNFLIRVFEQLSMGRMIDDNIGHFTGEHEPSNGQCAVVYCMDIFLTVAVGVCECWIFTRIMTHDCRFISSSRIGEYLQVIS